MKTGFEVLVALLPVAAVISCQTTKQATHNPEPAPIAAQESPDGLETNHEGDPWTSSDEEAMHPDDPTMAGVPEKETLPPDTEDESDPPGSVYGDDGDDAGYADDTGYDEEG